MTTKGWRRMDYGQESCPHSAKIVQILMWSCEGLLSFGILAGIQFIGLYEIQSYVSGL